MLGEHWEHGGAQRVCGASSWAHCAGRLLKRAHQLFSSSKLEEDVSPVSLTRLWIMPFPSAATQLPRFSASALRTHAACRQTRVKMLHCALSVRTLGDLLCITYSRALCTFDPHYSTVCLPLCILITSSSPPRSWTGGDACFSVLCRRALLSHYAGGHVSSLP